MVQAITVLDLLSHACLLALTWVSKPLSWWSLTCLISATVLSHSLTCALVRQCQLQPTVTEMHSWMQPTDKTHPGSEARLHSAELQLQPHSTEHEWVWRFCNKNPFFYHFSASWIASSLITKYLKRPIYTYTINMCCGLWGTEVRIQYTTWIKMYEWINEWNE